MIKYSKYLLSSIARKKTPYLIIIGFFLIFDFTSWLQIKEMNKNFVPMINTLSTFDKFFPFLFAAFFVAMIVIYAFKQGESDGSELMVVAKPLSRTQIILGKFFVVFIYLFSYILLTFLNYYGLSYLDKFVTSSERLNYALSLSVGGGVILVIIASILIICAAFFKKTGLLAIGVVAAAIIPILSFILSPVGKGQAFGYSFLSSNKQQIKTKSLIKELTANNNGEPLTGQSFRNIINPESLYFDDKTTYDTDFDKYKDEIWYDKASPVDLWYQWGRFYSIFQKDAGSKRLKIAHWKKEIKTIETSDENNITIAGEKYALYANITSLVDIPKIMPLLPNLLSEINSNKILWDNLSLYERLHTVNIWVNKIKTNSYKNVSLTSNDFANSNPTNFLQFGNNISSLTTMIYASLSINPTFTQPTSAYPNFIHLSKNKDGVTVYESYAGTRPADPEKLILRSSQFSKEGQKIYIFKPEEFIKTNYILIAWGALASSFLVMALILFLRRDFR